MGRPALSKSDLGEAARQMIRARLMLAGVKVFCPLSEDTPIDLLVLRANGQVLRCQCKCLYEASNGVHIMNLYAVRKSGPSKKAVKHRYTLREVDVFLGYCLSNDAVYVIPNDATQGRVELRLWIDREPLRRGPKKSFDPRPWLNSFHLLS